MANLIDRLVGVFSPDAGLRRMRARSLLQRAYEGASLRDGWKPRRAGASANTDHRADAKTLRARARSLVQNSPYIARGLGSLVANTVGTGITPRSMAANAAAIDALWSQWCSVADADGHLDLYGLQAAAYRAMEQDGEVLIRLRSRLPEDGLPVPLQLQLLEIDWLDSIRTGTNGSNTIINGIEYDPLGHIVAYWLWSQHPGEQLAVFKNRATSYPVPASSIIHLFSPGRPGQGRGFTRLAPVIARVRDLTLYEDAELQRKNLETRLSVIASGDVASMSQSESDDPSNVRNTGELGTLASGSIFQVPTGTNLTVVEPKAAPGYVDYVKFQLHIIASGMGVTYEMLTGDVKEVNFSSARVSLLEFRRHVEQMQWLTLIPKLCTPIWEAFINAAVLAGKIGRPDYRCEWSTPKWSYVNPVDDVRADLDAVAGGLSSLSEMLRQRGYKPDTVFAEIKSDFDRLRQDGTLDILLMLQAKQAPQPQAAAATAAAARAIEQAGQRHADLAQSTADGLMEARSEVRGIQAMLTAFLATRTDTVPAIHITNPVQSGPVEVRAEVAAPSVTVTNSVQPTPVEVRAEVAAPVVNVTNEITAQAGATQVHLQHPVRAVAEHERDAETQEILRTVTTFETDKGQP